MDLFLIVPLTPYAEYNYFFTLMMIPTLTLVPLGAVIALTMWILGHDR